MEVLGKLLLLVAALVPVMMQDAPPVIDCEDTWTGFWGRPGEIVCSAEASPDIDDARVTFYMHGDRDNDDNMVKLAGGESFNTKSFTFNRGPSSNLTLRVKQIFHQDFRNYTFVVGNSAGYTNVTVALEEDPASKVVGSAAWLRPSAITLGLIVILRALLWQ